MEVLASLTVGIGGGLPLGGDDISDEAAEDLAAATATAATELAAVLATVQQLDTVAAQAVTSGLSSLFGLMAASDGSASSASAGEQIGAAVEQMARAATTAALASVTVPSSGIAEPVVLSSANLNMTINVRSPSALAAEPISCDSGTGVAAAVAVPADLIGGIPGLDPLAYQSPAAGAGQAPCVGVPNPFSAAARACGTTVECKFWNETSRSWSTDGCATIMGADGSVGCSCTHLTEFIAIEFPTSAEELLALLLEAVAFNSLDMGDIECAFYRSWHTVRNVWYLIFLLVAMLIVLVGNGVRNDRRQMHDTLALLSDGSTEIISLSDPVGVATPLTESTSAMASLATASTRAAGPAVVGAGALGDPSPASAADPAAAPSAATASVLAAFGGGAKPTGLQRWKQAKHKTNATLLTKRWHKDVDRVWKRLCLACMYNHSLCAGITTRGVPGFTRAQTVMILVNGFAFELVMLLLLLPAPPPLPTDNVTGVPIEPEGPAVVINPIAMIFGAGVAASICIPMGLILTWLFDPIILVNVCKNMAWFYLCWPYWLVWKRLEKCYRWLRVMCKRRSAKVAEHSGEDPTSTAVASPPVSANVKQTFARFDVSHNGYLEIQELRKALEHYGLNLSTDEAGRIMSVYDDKPDGKLDLSEFAQAVRDLSAAEEAPKVKQTFARFDANDSGYLEIQELRKALEHHGLNLSTAEAGRIMSSYDDKPNGKLDLSEFAQVIHDLSAADEAPAAPEPVMKKTKTHMRVGRHGVNVRKTSAKDNNQADNQADKGEAAGEAAKAEAPRLAANSAARNFSYESLNDGLLKASLSYTLKNKDWPGMRHILLGWGLSIGMFGIFLLMTLLFGCSLFEPQDPAKNPYLPPLEEGEVSTHVPGDTVELIRTWLFSCGLRFFLNEPMIILASKGMPMLFASAFCANLCGEVIVESLNLLVTIMIEVIKSIKS
ncbi:calmodulin-like protein 5 [Chrysochromulina tobinii]|uniref:Calmodulin-like protein 5 n=1 Tax=Chrysochromulina tobinii TaxID=1460289 RepID=A0A0M0JQ98_9EUKA|nr:calmodulin-like protein 5 [Chrysochromulina tobinii]|eukprot:KOO28442.1 calmodulin-like protein 5 [Chrysochromulina sp. CCMP291]